MTLNEIAKKLIRQNKGRYLILSLSICFAILMTGAYGVCCSALQSQMYL